MTPDEQAALLARNLHRAKWRLRYRPPPGQAIEWCWDCDSVPANGRASGQCPECERAEEAAARIQAGG